MALTSGARLGPYEILGAIGAGGMGEVYRARDTRLSRDVAIKVLPASLTFDAERLSRFELEAKAVGQLNHPNVLSVYDVGAHEGAPYIVMELLDGETLRARLADGALPLRKGVDIAGQIALGLSAAHEKGVVHRDLKPENIFVTREGRVKILDFGLARVVGPPGGEASAATALQATDPGMVLGTVGYMSPEQVRGRPADARSDVFAFGAMLYEMLSGQRAFQRDSPADTMAAILKEDPAELSGSGRIIPASLDRLIHRCLEKNPDERFQSSRDLAFALDAVGGASSSSAVGVVSDAPTLVERSGPSRHLLALVAAGAVIAALAGGYVVGRLGARGASKAGGDVRLRQLTFNGGDASQPTLGPDGESFAFVSRAAGNDDVYLQRVGGENPINLTKDSPDDDYEPAFSPDGKLIAFRSDRGGGGIFTMGATGESVRRVTDGGFNPAWSPDGKELVFSFESVTNPTGRSAVAPIYRVDVATGAKRKIFDGDAVQPSWSPNGRFIAFWGLPHGSGRRAIFTIPADGGQPHVLVDDASYNWSPKWSRDGHFVYFASDRQRPMGFWRIPVDSDSGAADGPPERVAGGTEAYDGLSELVGAAFVFPSVATVGIVDRYTVDSSTGRLTSGPQAVLRSSRGMSSYVRPSPDGRYLSLMVDDVSEDLAVIRSDGTGFTRLTNDAFRDRGGSWAPDSDRLYFFSDRSGQYEVWSVRKDGSDLQQVTRRPPSSSTLSDPRLSPDGHTLLVLMPSTGKWGLVDLSGPLPQSEIRPLEVPDVPQFFAEVWSADGQSLVGGSRAKPGIFIYHLADRSVRTVPVANVGVIAMPDARTLLGVGIQDNRLRVVDIASGAVRVGDEIPPSADAVVLGDDHRTLYVPRNETVTNLWMLEFGRPRD